MDDVCYRDIWLIDHLKLGTEGLHQVYTYVRSAQRYFSCKLLYIRTCNLLKEDTMYSRGG